MSIKAEIKITISLPNNYNQGSAKDTLVYLTEEYNSIGELINEDDIVILGGTIRLGKVYMNEKQFRK